MAKKNGKATVKKSTKKKKAKPSNLKRSKTNQPPATTLQDIISTPRSDVGIVMHQCGCRHGDVGALRSFAKADAKYYSRQNKSLEGKSCLDCKLAVRKMESKAGSQRAVVYYCDEGIKGFDAPEEDPMKRELTCDLILCPNCEAKRRIEYNRADSGGRSSGVRKSRQRARV